MIDEQLTRLSQRAAAEKDPKKFIELMQELNRLLEEKRSRVTEKKVD